VLVTSEKHTPLSLVEKCQIILRCSKFFCFVFVCGATTPIGPRPLYFEVSRFHTIYTHTLSKTPLNEWSAHRSSSYLHNTHNKHKRRTFVPSSGFETAVPNIQQPQTYVLDRTVTGINNVTVTAIRFILNSDTEVIVLLPPLNFVAVYKH